MTSLISSDAPEQPSGDDSKRADAARIRDLYQRGVRDIRVQTLDYEENALYIEGQQHVYRHVQTNQILPMPKTSGRVRATIPRLGPESRRLFSKLLKRPLVFDVQPTASDDNSIRGARIAEGVLEDLARRQKWGRTRLQFAWALWKGGTAALCLDWDASAGQYLGTSQRGNAVGEGDVRVTPLAISEMVTEVGTRDIERACWWIKAQAVPPPEVKKMFHLKEEPQADANAAYTPVQMRLIRSGSGEVPKQLTLVLTYYERPYGSSKGMVATVVGDKIVDGPHDWPFPFTDRLNLVCGKETEVEGRWTGRTVVSDAVPVQTALNHAWTSILEHLKQAGNARVQANSMERTNAENWTDEPGQFIFYDGDSGFDWLSPPSMPDWWQRTPTELASAMDDIIGVHDVSRGDAPPNIESGLGVSILAEQDDTPTAMLSQTIADCFGDLATMVLETYQQNVLSTESRVANPPDPQAYIGEQFTWNGQSFAGQTVATVPYDAVAPINEAARFARAMALVDRQVIQGGPQLSAYIDIPGNASFIERINPQVAKARRENYEMANGEACVPVDFDNHQVHIEEHNVFRLSSRYERLPDQVRGIIDMHVQAHSTLAAEEAAKQMLKMQFAPGLAEAAQGGQPPGSAGGPPIGGQPPAAMDAAQMGPASAVMGAREGGAPDETTGGNPTPSPVEGELPL